MDSPTPMVTSPGKKQVPLSAQLISEASFGMITTVSAKAFVKFAMNKMAKSAKNGRVAHKEILLHDEHELLDFFINEII